MAPPGISIAERLRLQAALLARVEAGESVRELCDTAEFPTTTIIYRWARAEPWFRTALTDAIRRGTYRRRYAWDEAKAQAFLTRMQAGEWVPSLWRDPAMPTRRTYYYWRATQPTFAEGVARVKAAQRHARVLRGRDRRRAFDPAVADRIVARYARTGKLGVLLKTDRELPDETVVARWRREEPAFDRTLAMVKAAWRRKGRRRRNGCTRALTAEIGRRILAGETLAGLARRPDMPCERTLSRWMATEPGFAEAVEAAYELAAQFLEDQIGEIEAAAGRGRAAEAKRRTAPLRARLGRLRKAQGQQRRHAALRPRPAGPPRSSPRRSSSSSSSRRTPAWRPPGPDR